MKSNKSNADIILERIPPIISWTLITMPFWGGFLFPEFTANVVIFFNVYFLYKSISLTLFIFLSYLQLRSNDSINWLRRLEELDSPNKALEQLQQKENELKASKYSEQLIKKSKYYPDFFEKIWHRLLFVFAKRKSLGFINSEKDRLNEVINNPARLDWKEIRHIVIIPHWKEPLTVLEDTIKRLKNLNYPTNKISVVLAAEARDPEGIKKSYLLKDKYSQYFEHIWITEHEMQEGDLIGKSSNMAFASKELAKNIMALDWDPKLITITSCDADSQLPLDYFANLTYYYIFDQDSIFKFYTGAVQLYANIWRLPFFARVKNSMSTIYNVGRLIRTDKLLPFSTYTTSFWLIKEIGFWSPDIVPEDFHTFCKALFKFPSKVATVPLFQKIMSDAAEGEGSIDTIKNNYFQERRWSWGISDDGWIIKNMIKSVLSGKATLRSLYISGHIVFDHISGVGLALLVSLGGNIPLLINPRFANTVVGFNLPIVSSFIIQITLLFFVLMIIVDSLMKPTIPGKMTFRRRLILLLEWIVQPITSIFMVTIPGFEAHTRLLFGKYLEYYLTKKKD
jgi:hypothetical protein